MVTLSMKDMMSLFGSSGILSDGLHMLGSVAGLTAAKKSKI